VNFYHLPVFSHSSELTAWIWAFVQNAYILVDYLGLAKEHLHVPEVFVWGMVIINLVHIFCNNYEDSRLCNLHVECYTHNSIII
jgi:hypothetical protein